MKLLLILSCILFTGCATIAHKNIETKGYGISYKSTIAIESKDIPAFIDAVNKLEKLLGNIK